MANKNNGLSQKCILHDVLIKEFSYIWINSGEGVIEEVDISVAAVKRKFYWSEIFVLMSVIMP